MKTYRHCIAGCKEVVAMQPGIHSDVLKLFELMPSTELVLGNCETAAATPSRRKEHEFVLPRGHVRR